MPLRTNRNNDGKRFERLFKQVADEYKYRRVLRMEKCDPPTRIVGPGKILFLENPFADFVGSWTERGGRSILLEAKSTQDDRLPMGTGKLSDKQIEWLYRWHCAGAVVGVVWEAAFKVGFLPIGKIKQIADSGRRHLKFEDADNVPQGRGLILFDFVQNLRRWYPEDGTGNGRSRTEAGSDFPKDAATLAADQDR